MYDPLSALGVGEVAEDDVAAPLLSSSSSKSVMALGEKNGCTEVVSCAVRARGWGNSSGEDADGAARGC